MRPNLTGLSDAELAFLAGANRDAFGELVRRHQASLHAFLWRLMGNGAQAEDLAQDVFIRCHDKIASFRGDAAFRTWLFAIAYREFLRWRRRALLHGKLLRRLSEQVEDRGGIGPDDALSLQRALNNLGAAERAALLLCDACGMSHSEAAKTMSVPLGSLKTYVQRAREKMRQAMNCDADLEQERLVPCRTTL